MTRIVHTFTEYSSKSIEVDLGWGLVDSRLDQLDRLNAQNKDTLFAVGRKTIKASQYVGLVRLGDTTLQVLPKIAYQGNFDKPSCPPDQDAVQSAMRNLLVMLSIACGLPLRAQASGQLYSEYGDWLEILTRLFAIELHRQLQAGMSHSYITVEERLPVIHGRWLVGRQLSRNPHDKYRFDVSYDEFSPDTPINRIFALTVEMLWRLTGDLKNRRLLSDLRSWLAACNPKRDRLEADFSNVHFSRLNERFKPAFNLAKLFWEQRLIQLSVGDSAAFAFVFDMNLLFQDFIAQFLLRYREHILPSAWLDGEVVIQAKGQKVYLAEKYDPGQAAGKPVFHLAPDILLTSPLGAPFLIADTKYKRLSSQAADGGVAEGDVYQMLVYAQRWNCQDVMLIYPMSGPLPKRFTILAGTDKQVKIRVVEINLEQPLEKPEGLIEDLRLAFMPD